MIPKKRRPNAGTLHLRIPSYIKDRLQRQADGLGLTLSAYVRLTLEQNAYTPLKLRRMRVKDAI